MEAYNPESARIDVASCLRTKQRSFKSKIMNELANGSSCLFSREEVLPVVSCGFPMGKQRGLLKPFSGRVSQIAHILRV